MPQLHPLQEAFNAGEFGERMHGRVQFDKYSNAGAVFQNILPLPQGGFTFRPGFRYIADAKSASVRPWLTPFVFSSTQAYVLELGAQTMRFMRNQAPIVVADTDAVITNGAFASNITGWTARNSGSGSSIAHDATNSDMNLIGNGSGNEARANQSITTSQTGVEHVIRFSVVGDPGDYITVRVGSSAGGSQYHADTKKYTGNHTIEFTPAASPFHLEFENAQAKTISIDDVSVLDDTPVEITTPWAEADLPNLSYAQSADVIYFCIGGAIRPHRLERKGHAAWSLLEVLLEDGPWLAENSTTTTLGLSATSGNGVTVTASATTGVNDDAGFLATDVGRLIRFKDAAADYTFLQITARTNSTVVIADIKGPNASATTATTSWRLGKFDDLNGWPAVVGFIQQRLALANTTKFPQTFWLSKSADLENFQDEDVDGDVQDDSAIENTFAALQVNTIRWFASRKKPVVGTQGGNWTLRSDGSVLTPTDLAADFEVTGGVARIQPLEVRSRLVFAQAQARKIMEFADVIQDSGVQGFDSFDLTILNDRVLGEGATQLAYQQEPDSTIWAVRTDGQAPTLTYQPDQNVVGWARQIHGGAFQGGDAVIESLTCIPGQDGSGQFKDSSGRFEVWAAVKMEIGGSTVRYIECLEKLFNGTIDLQEDAFYVDSGLTLDNPKTITAITKANPGVVTSASHGFSNDDLVRIVRVKGMTEVNNLTFKVAGATTNTFNLTNPDGVNVNTTSHTTYSTGGEVREKVTTISGLAHLEGQSVQVFADGAVQTAKTVSSGAITLDAAASLVHVGLSYERRFKTLKLAFGAREGSAIGKPKNINDVILVLLEAAEGSLSVATEDEDGENTFTELDLRAATDIDDDPVPFFTGEKPLGVAAAFGEDIRLVIKGSSPVPATVIGVAPELEVTG
jgi:hypothetical protein